MSSPIAPKLPKKTSRNTPRPFMEAITIKPPQQLSLPLEYPGLRGGHLQKMIIATWVLACLALGIGVGLWLNSARSNQLTWPGSPVAAPAVVVSSVPEANLIFQPEGTEVRGAINPAATVTIMQFTAGTAALQPDYAFMSPSQGTVGTSPVK